jgi:hypothetical protein
MLKGHLKLDRELPKSLEALDQECECKTLQSGANGRRVFKDGLAIRVLAPGLTSRCRGV